MMIIYIRMCISPLRVTEGLTFTIMCMRLDPILSPTLRGSGHITDITANTSCMYIKFMKVDKTIYVRVY